MITYEMGQRVYTSLSLHQGLTLGIRVIVHYLKASTEEN